MRIEVNGRPALAEDLFGTYGHFTAMQVRGGGAQGLANHLDRLDAANRELFDEPLDPDRVRGLIRRALAGDADAAVRVAVREPGKVAVSVAPPTPPVAGPQRLRSVPYLRPFPHIKHLGGFAQGEWARRVRRDGYDDALLTAADGAFSESSIANIGFFAADGAVVWPHPPWLHGTAMRLVEDHRPTIRRRITLADVSGFHGAFLVNSIGTVAVASIDDVPCRPDPPLMDGLDALLAAVPWDPI
ncbi:aminotransferase class IV [Asanoa sp. WMMD1127]|uniref:aminotransferase class IV n=1 Tax=Asanoa sp. WMMD1127 TaxID=3016107 RepID=UPI0024165723|nr:aminotransferase class IV [Asanoa sp. WMMD1127]MDG4823136.1 aminotransferase class IV [Asanoa sp. WMMD1127]